MFPEPSVQEMTTEFVPTDSGIVVPLAGVQVGETPESSAVGRGAQRLMPDSYVSVQRDYDGTPMISDAPPDEFYLTMAKALREKGEGCIQYTQASARIDDPERGPRYDFNFNQRPAEEWVAGVV